MTAHPLFTIGHSSHPLERFIGLLQQHNIAVVADVRSAPYSRYNPQFNKDSLASSLKEQGIKYLFFGKEPGARVEDPECYIDGQVDYSLLAARPEFKQAIARLIKGSQDYRIALMCAEKWPLVCHRTILVAQALANADCDILHILADGALEQHQELLKQLPGLQNYGLFEALDDPAVLLQNALRQQEQRIAYRLPAETDNKQGDNCCAYWSFGSGSASRAG